MTRRFDGVSNAVRLIGGISSTPKGPGLLSIDTWGRYANEVPVGAARTTTVAPSVGHFGSWPLINKRTASLFLFLFKYNLPKKKAFSSVRPSPPPHTTATNQPLSFSSFFFGNFGIKKGKYNTTHTHTHTQNACVSPPTFFFFFLFRRSSPVVGWQKKKSVVVYHYEQFGSPKKLMTMQ